MTARLYNALFLCSGNSARSIMAESILRKDGSGRFQAYSAGSRPKAAINPLALRTLQAFDYPCEGLRSKSWDEFVLADAPAMDFIFTVCDSAAGETCPIWLGHPATAHWGVEDPAAAEGSEMEKLRAFATAFRYLQTRISLFLALPLDKLDAMTLGERLRDIGRSEGATRNKRAAAAPR